MATLLTTPELGELKLLLAAPERVEIHGADRSWRAHLLGAIMATAAMSFGPAQAASPESAPSFVPGAQATVPGAEESLVAAAMRRAGAQEIAIATRSTQVAMFPFPCRATLASAELRGQVEAYVGAHPGLLPPVNGGPERTGAYIESIATQIDHPHAWAYASKAPSQTGCVILVPDRAVPEFGDLMRFAGLDRDTAAAFVLAHEAAHCAQYSEGLAVESVRDERDRRGIDPP